MVETSPKIVSIIRLPCRKCTGRGFHFLTCPVLKLPRGWRFELTASGEESDEWPEDLFSED